MPIFDRNQGEIARTGFAITQAQEQEKFTNGQVLTDVRDAFENLRSNDQIVGLYRSGYLDEAKQSRDISEYSYRHGAASLLDFLDAERSYRATELAYRQALASYLHRTRTASRSSRNQELAMTNTPARRRNRRLQSLAALALAFVLTACSSKDREHANKMTSFSATASSSSIPQLFTIPEDQMSHVQVVTVQPSRLTRTLRLTGAVAYNAFKTTPVITQVGGPVSRILVVPGQKVNVGQPMLDVSSPDYSQLLDAYLKAADSSRLADKNYNARKIYTSTMLSPSAILSRPNRIATRPRRT